MDADLLRFARRLDGAREAQQIAQRAFDLAKAGRPSAAEDDSMQKLISRADIAALLAPLPSSARG